LLLKRYESQNAGQSINRVSYAGAGGRVKNQAASHLKENEKISLVKKESTAAHDQPRILMAPIYAQLFEVRIAK
jgi:hypothetical protein